jgi:hypothetical protein
MQSPRYSGRSHYHFSGASRNSDPLIFGANPQAPIQWAHPSSFESMTARRAMVPQRPWQSGQPRDMAPPPHSSQPSDHLPAPQSAPQLVQ